MDMFYDSYDTWFSFEDLGVIDAKSSKLVKLLRIPIVMLMSFVALGGNGHSC